MPTLAFSRRLRNTYRIFSSHKTVRNRDLRIHASVMFPEQMRDLPGQLLIGQDKFSRYKKLKIQQNLLPGFLKTEIVNFQLRVKTADQILRKSPPVFQFRLLTEKRIAVLIHNIKTQLQKPFHDSLGFKIQRKNGQLHIPEEK